MFGFGGPPQDGFSHHILGVAGSADPAENSSPDHLADDCSPASSSVRGELLNGGAVSNVDENELTQKGLLLPDQLPYSRGGVNVNFPASYSAKKQSTNQKTHSNSQHPPAA